MTKQAAGKITNETLVSAGEVGVVVGVSSRRIEQLAQDGKLEKVGRGKYLLADSVQKFYEIREEKAQQQEKALQAAEIALKTAKASKADLEAKELQGNMHRSKDVAALVTDMIMSIRGQLLTLPGRVANEVAATENAAEAAEIIRAEVWAIMEDISKYKYDPAKYAARVRQRMNWEQESEDKDGEG